jgi:hypothetical protein
VGAAIVYGNREPELLSGNLAPLRVHVMPELALAEHNLAVFDLEIATNIIGNLNVRAGGEAAETARWGILSLPRGIFFRPRA